MAAKSRFAANGGCEGFLGCEGPFSGAYVIYKERVHACANKS